MHSVARSSFTNSASHRLAADQPQATAGHWPPPELGPRLAWLRRQRQLSEAELAAAVGISRPRLKKIEQNSVSPSMALLNRLLATLQCSPRRLLSMPEGNMSRSWRAVDRADPAKARHALGGELSQKAMLPQLIRLCGGEALALALSGDLFLLVLRGRLQWGSTANLAQWLGPGDSLYQMEQPHCRLVAEQGGAELLLVAQR